MTGAAAVEVVRSGFQRLLDTACCCSSILPCLNAVERDTLRLVSPSAALVVDRELRRCYVLPLRGAGVCDEAVLDSYVTGANSAAAVAAAILPREESPSRALKRLEAILGFLPRGRAARMELALEIRVWWELNCGRRPLALRSWQLPKAAFPVAQILKKRSTSGCLRDGKASLWPFSVAAADYLSFVTSKVAPVTPQTKGADWRTAAPLRTLMNTELHLALLECIARLDAEAAASLEFAAGTAALHRAAHLAPADESPQRAVLASNMHVLFFKRARAFMTAADDALRLAGHCGGVAGFARYLVAASCSDAKNDEPPFPGDEQSGMTKWRKLIQTVSGRPPDGRALPAICFYLHGLAGEQAASGSSSQGAAQAPEEVDAVLDLLALLALSPAYGGTEALCWLAGMQPKLVADDLRRARSVVDVSRRRLQRCSAPAFPCNSVTAMAAASGRGGVSGWSVPRRGQPILAGSGRAGYRAQQPMASWLAPYALPRDSGGHTLPTWRGAAATRFR